MQVDGMDVFSVKMCVEYARQWTMSGERVRASPLTYSCMTCHINRGGSPRNEYSWSAGKRASVPESEREICEEAGWTLLVRRLRIFTAGTWGAGLGLIELEMETHTHALARTRTQAHVHACTNTRTNTHTHTRAHTHTHRQGPIRAGDEHVSLPRTLDVRPWFDIPVPRGGLGGS